MVDSETKYTYDNAILILRHQIEKCHDKYSDGTGRDRLTTKFTILYDVIRDYEIVNQWDLPQDESLNLLFNLGIMTGICTSYLETGELNKEDVSHLNKIYRKYKNEKK